MCYGMGCKYEHSWTGECKLGGRPPADAACREDDDMVCNDCNHEFIRSDSPYIDEDTVRCPSCGSADTDEA